MSFLIAHGVWLEKEVRRVKSVLLVHLEDGREYTVEELLSLLKNYGLDYSNPSYAELGAVLLADGFLEAA